MKIENFDFWLTFDKNYVHKQILRLGHFKKGIKNPHAQSSCIFVR